MSIASSSVSWIVGTTQVGLLATMMALMPATALGQSPADVVDMGIAGNDHVYAWYRGGTVSVGVSSQLECHRRQSNYSVAAGIAGQAGKSPTDIVAIAIACLDGHTYVWYRDGTVSSGSSDDLDRARAPYSYTLPPGKSPADIVGVGIASDDHVFAWYRDGTVSSGTSNDLDRYRAPYRYSLPSGKTPADIVGIAIACLDGHTYVWYRDGTVSSGSSADLDRARAPYTYTLPPGKTPTDVVDMGIAKDDRVYAWYRDAKVSSGTTNDLDRYRALYGYSVVTEIPPIPAKTPRDIVAMAIDCSDDHVFAWYKDGTVSSGTSTNLDVYRKLYRYALPTGKTTSDIVGVGIANDDHVFAWYRDGTVSSGTSEDLDKYRKPYGYTLPPGKTPNNIVAMAIACSDNSVYTWYRDGTVSSGTSDDLDRHRAPYTYNLQLLPPAAPSELRISGTGSSSLQLAWKDNSSCETRFRIEERVGGQWQTVDTVGRQDVERNDEHYTVESVSPGDHCYRVKATNSAGASDPSNNTCGKTAGPSGYSKVRVYNCHVDRRSIKIWMRDNTEGGPWEQQGSLASQWKSNQCPSGSPFEVNLTSSHLHDIRAVDPAAIGCGGNDPTQAACQRLTLPAPLLGYGAGSSFEITVQ